MMKSIQTKFIILILGCVLGAAILIGGAGIISSERVIEEDSATIMNLLCESKAQDIDGTLTCIEQAVNTLAGYVVSQIKDINSFQEDETYVDTFSSNIKDVVENAAKNTQGAIGVYVRFNPQIARPDAGLFLGRRDINEAFYDIVPTDISKYSKTDLGHVGWYYIPVENERATWMDPYVNENINMKIISYVIPIYFDHTVVGIVGMDIDYKMLEEIVKETSVYDTGYAFLADENATIMSHHEIPGGTRMGDVDASLISIERQLMGASSGNKLFAYQFNGQNKKMVFQELVNGMKLIVTAPSKEIDDTKNSLMKQIAICVLAIIVMSLILTIGLTRKIIKPLKELTSAAQKIAEGDLSITVASHSKDEVGILAESFRQTVTHLQKYIDYINSLAYIDALTGVKNNTAYREAVKKYEKLMRIGRPSFAVVVMDINGLKSVNDTYGHEFGDILIMDACKIICKAYKHSPVYRIGGDEFVVILENEDLQNYSAVMSNFQSMIKDYNDTSKSALQIAIAQGIAHYNYEIDLVFTDVFKRADDAMYENKADMKKNGCLQ